MIIGISGKKGSGKDTIAQYLCSEYGFRQESFAYPLKQACSVIFGVPMDWFHDPALKESRISGWDESPRRLMQIVGTDLFRNHYDNDVWVKSMSRRLTGMAHQNIVVSDIRFTNEAQCILDMGGILIHVIRDAKDDSDPHESEQQSDKLLYKAHKVFHNDSEISDLHRSIDQWMSSHNTQFYEVCTPQV